jgi:hypothetical protein
MAETRGEKPEPVATIYRVQHSGTCQDCGKGDVTVIEADIGQSNWMLICLNCLGERLREMQERMGADGQYRRFGQPSERAERV